LFIMEAGVQNLDVPQLRFGVNLREADSWAGFQRLIQRAEELGYDAFAAPDHLGAMAPFPTLAAAAGVSDRLRLRTYVLNAGFHNAALLARDVATVDVLSAGRVEVGLGAGHMKSEHDDAGLPWPALEQRVQALEVLALALRRRLADAAHLPRPVQQPVPILIGAMSSAGLAVAARHADVVGFSGLRQAPGAPVGTFELSSAQQTRERVDLVRRIRGEVGARPYGSDALLQVVDLGRDPLDAARDIAAGLPHLDAEQVLDTPFVLLARTAEEGARELLRRHEAYGFDSFTTHQHNLEPLAEVIAALR
jgi:probable F420-dependent oxidoreductase